MRPSTVLSLLLFITTGLLAFSASGQSTWRRTYGASGSDNGASVISCSDGGFLVAGSTGSFGGGAGDVYLLCSDGLYDMVDEAEMRRALEMFGTDLDRAARYLIQMANDHGGDDNISVIVVRVVRKFPAASGSWAKLWSWLR